ncbi:MAG TPA: uracil-DNA glycosylase [Desulfobacteraceae bacterium]|nr:uracil-DNA glycosylase [Desulfobacteraceae bacterium]|tara:strand:+ start:456 stop:1049 length:594 start_codon:yes stop_codon:yes gene_type:complete
MDPDNTNILVLEDTPAFVAKAFVETVTDLAQYISNQRDLGNTDIRLSDQTMKTINSWGTPDWSDHGFSSQGPETSDIVIVDSSGSFFEGPAGSLLAKILKAMRLNPPEVYICNTADPDRLFSHIGRCSLKAVIAFGEKAGQILLGREEPLSQFRGRLHPINNTKFMATHHPVDLLDNPGLKRQVWDDMQVVMKHAGL